jgi:hypothetical protein
MKASELIDSLQNLIAIYGDLKLRVIITKYGYDLVREDFSFLDFEEKENEFISEIELFNFS